MLIWDIQLSPSAVGVPAGGLSSETVWPFARVVRVYANSGTRMDVSGELPTAAGESHAQRTGPINVPPISTGAPLSKSKFHLKDSVFCAYFSSPDGSRKLVLSLHPDWEDTLQSIDVVTKDCILAGGIHNDLALLVRRKGRPDRLILVECQTSWDSTVAFRIGEYWPGIIRLYTDSIEQQAAQRAFLSDPPDTECYCIYTGPEGNHPETLMVGGQDMSQRGSDEPQSDIVIRVHMLYYNAGDDNIINQYIRFCRILQLHKEELRRSIKRRLTEGELRDAVIAAIRQCLEEHVMEVFLRSRRAEVISMLTAEQRAEQEFDAYIASITQESAQKLSRANQEKDAAVQARDAAVQERDAAVQEMGALRQHIQQVLEAYRHGALSAAELEQAMSAAAQ